MVEFLLFTLSAVSHGSVVVTPAVISFDLARVRVSEPTCADRGQTDEIVVCAPKGMDIWIADASGFAVKPLEPEFAGPLNSRTTVHVVQQTGSLGQSPAAVVTIKWKF